MPTDRLWPEPILEKNHNKYTEGKECIMNKSNYIFRGKNCSIEKHWDGESYMLLDNQNKPILIGTLQQIQAEYDRREQPMSKERG